MTEDERREFKRSELRRAQGEWPDDPVLSLDPDPELARLRALSDAATPGPWFEHNAHGPWVSNARFADGYGEFVADTEFSETGRVPAEDAPHASENAALIVAAVNYVRAVLRDAAERMGRA